MTYSVADLKKDIRVAIDQNMVSDELVGLEDVDTLSLEEIIESKIADAAKIVMRSAPPTMLDGGHAFGDSIMWDSAPGYGSGRIALPDDFLKLVCFQMSDWSYAVTVPIYDDNPLYVQQKSRYPGVRGCPQRPVVAIVSEAIGPVLEFYSCSSGNAYIKRARYLKIPKIENGGIEFCEKLRPAVVYYAAAMTAQSVGNGDLAGALMGVYNELIAG